MLLPSRTLSAVSMPHPTRSSGSSFWMVVGTTVTTESAKLGNGQRRRVADAGLLPWHCEHQIVPAPIVPGAGVVDQGNAGAEEQGMTAALRHLHYLWIVETRYCDCHDWPRLSERTFYYTERRTPPADTPG